MRNLSRLFAMGLLATAAACAGPRGVVFDDQKANMHKLAVASALGNTFQGTYRGLTVFNNKKYEADVSAWKVDEVAVKVAIDSLKREGRFEVVPVTGSLQGKDASALIAAARAAGADTLVVVVPAEYGNLPYLPPGYGFRHELLGGKKRGVACTCWRWSTFTTWRSRTTSPGSGRSARST